MCTVEQFNACEFDRLTHIWRNHKALIMAVSNCTWSSTQKAAVNAGRPVNVWLRAALSTRQIPVCNGDSVSSQGADYRRRTTKRGSICCFDSNWIRFKGKMECHRWRSIARISEGCHHSPVTGRYKNSDMRNYILLWVLCWANDGGRTEFSKWTSGGLNRNWKRGFAVITSFTCRWRWLYQQSWRPTVIRYGRID